MRAQQGAGGTSPTADAKRMMVRVPLMIADYRVTSGCSSEAVLRRVSRRHTSGRVNLETQPPELRFGAVLDQSGDGGEKGAGREPYYFSSHEWWEWRHVP